MIHLLLPCQRQTLVPELGLKQTLVPELRPKQALVL